MAQATVLTLLSQTPHSSGPTVNGSPQQAAAYYLGNRNLQTITYNFSNVTATLIIDATLADTPTNDDWFSIYTLTVTSGMTASFENISGNYVWLRCRVNPLAQGVIQSVKVSY